MGVCINSLRNRKGREDACVCASQGLLVLVAALLATLVLHI